MKTRSEIRAIAKRQADQEKNLDYFVDELLKIQPVVAALLRKMEQGGDAEFPLSPESALEEKGSAGNVHGHALGESTRVMDEMIQQIILDGGKF
jgi:hypothetical protein